jgi:uncharacterized membrane protein
VLRRDTARLTGALALAISFAPSLLRRSRREQLAVSAASAALGGPAAVSLVMGHGADSAEIESLADLLVRREVERGARLRRLRRGEADG